MIENSHGVILELDHASVLGMRQFGKKHIKVVWREDNNIYDFVFECEQPAELASKYNTIQMEFFDMLKSIDVKTAARLKIRSEHRPSEPCEIF